MSIAGWIILGGLVAFGIFDWMLVSGASESRKEEDHGKENQHRNHD